MSNRNYNNINVKKEINCRDIEAIYGKFVILDCGFCNFNDVVGQNLTISNGSFTNIYANNIYSPGLIVDFTNITGTSLTYTNGSFTNLTTTNLSALNANITNLNLNNTTISNISLTQTTLSNIPYVRYDDTLKKILYKNNHYGEFISTSLQPVSVNNTLTLVYNSSFTYGINTNNLNQSEIIISQNGIYKIGTSIQFDVINSSSKVDCYFWFRKNGNDIPNSATAVHINSKGDIQSGYAEIIQQFNASDKIQVVIGSNEGSIEAYYAPASTSVFIRPAIPSVITTVYQLD